MTRNSGAAGTPGRRRSGRGFLASAQSTDSASVPNANRPERATQSKASIPSSDQVQDQVTTQPCHGTTPWSNPGTTPEPETDLGGPSCDSPASTLDADTASPRLLLPDEALTALATPASAALSRLRATPLSARAWASLLRRIDAVIQAGGPVLWDDVLELYALWLQGQMATGALDEGTGAKYLDLVTQFVNHCRYRAVVIPSVQVAERLGTPLAQGWVDDLGSDRRSKNPVLVGPAIKRQRRSAGRSLWYVLRLFKVSERDLFADVEVPQLPGGPKCRPLDDSEALALRLWATAHPWESAQNAAVAGALLGASQDTLSQLRVCDIDLAQGIIRMPGHGKNQARIQALDSFALAMFTLRIEHLHRLHEVADGNEFLDWYLLSSKGQPMTASNAGMLLRAAIEYAAIRSDRITPMSLALWGSLRAYHHGPAATVLTATAHPLGIRDIDAAAYVRGVTTRTASDSLGRSTADKGDDPYGLANY